MISYDQSILYIDCLTFICSSFPYFSSLFTYPLTYITIWFMLINFSKALFSVPFVIILAGLSCLLIHYIFISLCLLYNYQIAIISIISRFYLVVLSLTRHLYSKYKSIYIIISSDRNLSWLVIILIVILIAIAISTPPIIP